MIYGTKGRSGLCYHIRLPRLCADELSYFQTTLRPILIHAGWYWKLWLFIWFVFQFFTGLRCYFCYSIKQYWNFECVYPYRLRANYTTCSDEENVCAKTTGSGMFNGEIRDIMVRHCSKLSSGTTMNCFNSGNSSTNRFLPLAHGSKDAWPPKLREVPTKLTMTRTCYCSSNLCNDEDGHDILQGCILWFKTL